MQALFVLLLVVLAWVSWRKVNKRLYNDGFSPFNLLFYFWVAPFLLGFADLSALQTGLDGGALTIILTSTAILVGVSLLPAMLLGPSGAKRPGTDPTRPTRIRPLLPLAFYALTVLMLYLAEFRDRDLPLISYVLGGASDSNLHTYGKDSKLQVIAFGIYSAAIFTFQLWLQETRRWRRFFYLSLSLVVIALGVFKASKSDIYIPILSYGCLYYYHLKSRNRTIPKAYFAIAGVIALVVVSVTSIRLEGVGVVGGYSGLIAFEYSDQVGPVLSEIASIVYGYTALGFQNFSNYVVSHPVEIRLGTSLFRPFLSIFMLGSVADAAGVPVDEWNVVSDAANTGTILTPLYIEGGFLLCFLGSVLYALFVNVAYFHFRSTRTLRWMFIYTSLLFPWTWMFFTNAFSTLSIFVNVFYVAVLSWLCIGEPWRARRIVMSRKTEQARILRSAVPSPER